MGRIRVTKAGYLYFDFYYRGVRCREYTELRDTPANQKLMDGALQRIEEEIKQGTFAYAKYFPDSKQKNQFAVTAGAGNCPCFEEYANFWYRNNYISWKPSVQDDYHSTLTRHLIPYFRSQPVNAITKWNIKEFRTFLSNLDGKKGAKISNKRINNIIVVLRSLINEAAEQYEFMTPFQNLKPLPTKKADVHPFSLDEVWAFLHVVPKEFYNYYVVRFFTGMRPAEIDGLKCQYVDFNNKRILVRDTWSRKRWVTPKTSSSVRDIDMFKIVEDALHAQMEKTGGGLLVFPNKENKPFDYNNISKRIWYPTLKKAMLAPRTPYQTRHTAASLWLASGENPEWVARQLGHSNTEMLFKVYSKFIPNLTRRDGSAFEQFYSRKIEEHAHSTEKNETLNGPENKEEL